MTLIQRHKSRFVLASILGSLMLLGALAAYQTGRRAAKLFTVASEITIPFELINRHVVIAVMVNGRPLSFVLDTGNRFAIIDFDRAKEMGLPLAGQVRVKGAGTQAITGAFVRDSTFRIPAFAAFSQPVTLAIPLSNLAPRLGHDFDGIIGSEFIEQFVLELDYQARLIKLHDRDGFAYSGAGESIPTQVNSDGHPIVAAQVTPIGGDPLAGKFVLDIGAGVALALYSPFVAAHHLPGPAVQTIRSSDGAGTGGRVEGRIGRVAELKIGSIRLSHPITLFSDDKAGAFADSSIQGNIGEQILSRFKVFLDYSHDRIILEPNSMFTEPFRPAQTGIQIEAERQDYTTFRVKGILENSPAATAGLQVNDVIIAIDGQDASTFTLSRVLEMFERPVLYQLLVRRGGQTLMVTLAPKSLV